MTNQEALLNIKRLCDTAIKSGLIPTLGDAEVLAKTFSHIQAALDVQYSNNNQQLQSIKHDKKVSGGFETADLP